MDMQNFAAERTTMVDTQIRTNDVTWRPLLEALYTVPREAYVPAAARPLAYMDNDLPLPPASAGTPSRRLLAPMVFAKLAQLAAIRETDKVLDVGAATGYSTAVLARLSASVVGLECSASLADEARGNLVAQGVGNASVVTGPLEAGCAAQGPYDVIFVNGSVNKVSENLLAQLAEGGRLVAIIAETMNGKAYLFQKVKGEVHGRAVFDAGAGPLPGFAETAKFVF
jgi:protein-L-isoaspartate(D-aspartate) O-methyltransferase